MRQERGEEALQPFAAGSELAPTASMPLAISALTHVALGEVEMEEQQVLRGQTRCDAVGKEAGMVIAGQREDPQGSLGARQERRSQRCCFSITQLQQVVEISAAVGCYFPGP